MNVIVSNKNQNLLANLNIDVIKNINGVFSVEDLLSQFKNFFFNKMVLDITAIENYEDINTIQKLSLGIDMNKVILLLDDSVKVNSGMYLSQLVSMGIYNFTKNIDTVAFLIDNPNDYRDVARYHQLNMSSSDFALNDNAKSKQEGFIGQRIIGIKNVTLHAGSTTFAYILKSHIDRLYKVKALEINKSDINYFNDKNCQSIESTEVEEYLLNNKKEEVILLVINDDEDKKYCTDMLYLIEPGIIPLNRLVETDNRIFDTLRGKKIILNKSALSSKDVSDFEKESGSKVFYNIPCIDDKENDIKEIKEFLIALGFTRFSEDKHSSFGLFK